MTIEYKDSKRIVGLSKSTTVANTKSISSQTTNVIDLAVKPDGTEIYVATEDTGKVITYELATAGDVSTAVYNSSKDYTHSLTNPKGMDWNNDGTKIYLASFNTEKVHTYTVSTAYNLSSTVTQVGTGDDLSGIDGAQALQWSHDGAYLFQADNSGVIHRYEVATAFVVSDGTRTSFNPSETTAVTGISFGDNGKEMYIVSHANTGLFKYTLSPAYDLSTATHDSTLTTTDADNQGIATSNGKIYVLGQTTDIVTDYNNDIKPTNVQDNSLFVEKDTARRYWFSEALAPTFEDDFTSNSAWTQTGSDITIASNQLTWIGDRQNASHGIHHDMGANVVNTSAWTLAFDLILDNYSAGTASNTHQFGVMMTNVDSSVGSLGSNATRDFIGMSLNWRTDTASEQRKFYAKDDNGSTDTWADNSPYNTPDDSTSQGFPTAGDTYHIKIIRTSTTAYKIEIWNSDESSLLDTLNGACSNTSDLRYILVQKYGDSADGNPSFDGKIDNMKFYNSVVTPATWNLPEIEYSRGIMAGGHTYTNVIQYFTIATLGNATDFGDLTTSRRQLASATSGTRGVFMGGYTSSAGNGENTIDYVTIATPSNATDFGDLTAPTYNLAGVSSDTRGVTGGGVRSGSAYTNVMEYITIATAGNSVDYGDLTSGRHYITGASSKTSETRGLFAGGYTGSNSNVIDYITIATISNATDFGDLTVARREPQGNIASDVRAVFTGGTTSSPAQNTIDYVTIATTGNATDFGDLATGINGGAGCSSKTRGITMAGYNGSSYTNQIQYITIATTGNATDFGDLINTVGEIPTGTMGE